MKRICFLSVSRVVGLLLVVLATAWPAQADGPKRQIVSLDGTWQIQKGGADLPTTPALGQAPVPGLTDMAQNVNGAGDYWWYVRTFTLATAPTEVAQLKINKSMFGTRVYLNGKLIDDYFSCFSPSYHDVRAALNFNGANTLVVRVGERSTLPPTVLDMHDPEKASYIPGLYDSVSLILDNNPHIATVQTNPRLDGTLEIKAGIQNRSGSAYKGPVRFTVRRVDTNEVVGEGETTVSIPAGGQVDATAVVTVKGCQFWTPEKPFLYTLTTGTAGDERTDRFGMRTFGFNAKTKMPMLNGKTYPMFGTNICMFRFFEDPQRGTLPWNKEWARALLRKFKTMNWNSMRLTIGPPPDFWYDLFDEEGILVQDEAPIWYQGSRTGQEKVPAGVTVADLVAEETPCIYDRCNHPSIYVWDLANETTSEKVREAIPKLRPIDLQGRRWEDGTGGFNKPVADDDPVELHPYPFIHPGCLEVFNKPVKPVKGDHPLIVNEYGWLWLARDGSPTRLTAHLFEYLVGGGVGSRDYGTEADRRYIAATYLAADTEYLRASRQYAMVQQFCGLGYSRPVLSNPAISGQTSDNFLIPLSALNFDPYFENYLRDAFAPVGLCVERYDSVYPAGSMQAFPVSVYNDSQQPWKSEVRLMVVAGGSALNKRDAAVVTPAVSRVFQLDPNEKSTQTITLKIPQATGDYSLVAEYGDGPTRVQCVRDFVVGKQPRWVQTAKVSAAAPPAK